MSQLLRIPSHYYVYSDPPDKNGDEMLHFVSGHRRIRLRGHSFRDFVQRVAPLLDGTRTVEQIQGEVGDLFAPADLHDCLEMLGSHGLLEDAGLSAVPADLSTSLRPQMNVFHDLSTEPEELQRRLLTSRATIFGAGGLGASCALALAAAGLGSVDCVDPGRVSAADTYFSTVFDSAAIGAPRTDALRRRIETANAHTRYRSHSEPLASDDDVRHVVEGSDFVINCLDDGEIALAYKVNRVCLSLGVGFTSAQASGVEVTLGPTVDPHKTACFLCYKMRSVACSDNPEAEFAFQSFLDRRRQDDSARGANLSFGVNIGAQLAAMEALKALTLLPSATARGRLYVLNLLTMAMQTHLVLRKPWCPACFGDWEESK
jgi:bacteriocin biosynthesis cyclodehydratase domain-containing protein